MANIATIDIAGVAVPRLAFGLGSLMKWAPGHTHPLPTDSSQKVHQAISAGFRHFNTGDLYTNNDSAAEALKSSGLKREELFFSLKLNTYALLGCRGRGHMIDNAKREIDRYGMNGYVDLLQLHFPPRGYPGNLSNREAWRVLEDLRDQGVARLIGLSNWTMHDYADIIDSSDLKHTPQINEYEFNPFLLFDPKFRELHTYEIKHGIVSMNYGILTAISGRFPEDEHSALSLQLQDESAKTGLTAAELLLYWAYHRLNGILVTSTSQASRAASLIKLLSTDGPKVPSEAIDGIEQAAKADGYQGKVFYGHGHIEKASRMEQ